MENRLARRFARLVELGRSRRAVFGAFVAAVTAVAGMLSNDNDASAAKTVKQCKNIKNKKKRKKCIKKARSHDEEPPQPDGLCADSADDAPCDSSCRVCQLNHFDPEDSAFDIVVSPSNELVTTTYEDNLNVLTLSGSLIRRIGEFGTDPGEFYSPDGIAIGSDGVLFVADYGNDRIQRLAPNGSIDVWPLESSPRSVAVNDSDVVYATSSGRVHRLDANGQVAYSWGPDGDLNESFDGAADIAVDGSHVYVVDEDASMIYRFTDNGAGSVVRDWVVGELGADPGEFRAPWGIAVDGSRVFVADYSNQRLQALDASSGTFLFEWIARDEYDYVFYPDAVAVGSGGKVYVTSSDGITTFEIRG